MFKQIGVKKRTVVSIFTGLLMLLTILDGSTGQAQEPITLIIEFSDQSVELFDAGGANVLGSGRFRADLGPDLDNGTISIRSPNITLPAIAITEINEIIIDDATEQAIGMTLSGRDRTSSKGYVITFEATHVAQQESANGAPVVWHITNIEQAVDAVHGVMFEAQGMISFRTQP